MWGKKGSCPEIMICADLEPKKIVLFMKIVTKTHYFVFYVGYIDCKAGTYLCQVLRQMQNVHTRNQANQKADSK